jgi:Flp pilus assembly protein TadG
MNSLSRRGSDNGAAVVEFVLVSGLLLMLFLGVVQVGLVLHMRNVITANAAEGARYAANAQVDPAAGGPRASELTAQSLSREVAGDITCTGALEGELVAVTCQGRLPLTFLPIGSVHLYAVGHAVKEQP